MQQFLRHHGLFLLGLIATALLFAPVLSFEFVSWDDEMLVTGNPLLQASFFDAVRGAWTRYDPELYVPLTTMSLLLDRTLWGFSSAGFHASNLLLHLISACLVYAVLLRMRMRPSLAAFSALLWAIHPLQVETVAWVSARKDLLASLFALGAILLFLRARERGKGLLGSIVFFGLGLLSKVAIAPLPLLLLLEERRQQRPIRRALHDLLPFFLLAAAFGVIAVFGKTRNLETLTPLETLLLSAHALLFYLWKLLWPASLSIVYPVADPISLGSPMLLASALGTIVLGIWIWIHRRSAPIVCATLWYLLLLIPSFLSFDRAGHVSYGSDHYAYLAILGPIVLLTYGITHFLQTKTIWKVLLALAALCGSAVFTTLRLPAWQSSETLYRASIETVPQEAFLHYNLGVDLARAKRLTEAKEALMRATQLDPDFSEAWSNLASACASLEEWDDAWRAVEHAIRANPSNAHAYNMRGVLLLQEQEYRAAIDDFKRAITLQPDFALAYRNLGDALGKLGRYEEGLEALRKAQSIE